ncbi:MAG: Gfo/Idh/MocA family oxidoreductase [Bifidobacteriaceae bacterium]|jgi:predicted dehydrogenase|nr:Gfo/Idh/MocA family oxidoreductase [Bifidobacteriaceae bacterium]
MTIKIGILGTSWIATQAVYALKQIKAYEIKAVLGTSLESANEFIAENVIDAKGYDNYNQFLADDINCVYIALPNSLHFQFAVQALENGKNAIVEKPIFSTVKEYDEAKQLADDKGLYLLEAMRSVYTKNHNIVRQLIKNSDHITGGTIIWKNYSSKYNNYKKGEQVRVFSKNYSGGALADLGVYALSAAVDWFGMPDAYEYISRKVQRFASGKIESDAADSGGVIILKYKSFDISILLSKTQESFQNSEIYTDDSTFELDNIAAITTIKKYFTAADKSMGFHDDKAGRPYEELAQAENADGMLLQEFEAFASIIENGSTENNNEKLYTRSSKLSKNVLTLLNQLNN